ncbi:hypothetical protein JOQ06_028565, partial [Pogonophryne albipinna]
QHWGKSPRDRNIPSISPNPGFTRPGNVLHLQSAGHDVEPPLPLSLICQVRIYSEWKWSETDEIANFTNWAVGEPNHDDENCVFMNMITHKWNDAQCIREFSFLCSDETLVLVKERKTWDQALRHCRLLEAENPNEPVDLTCNYRYDLASVRTEDDRAYARLRAGEASTDQVWTGLRFLAGQWFWTGDGEAVQDVDEEMQCGRTQSFCGVLVKNSTKRYETEDCSKKLNFLCYRKP